ncbi:Mycoplasma protein of unknown function, DUF285 [Seminavis robusta]|uniref:Uncharacterized protein n=1 Tax=Seminavis robusta TaxID=568900 RepID=A0A9N8HIC3_9STRA|nr:Mycoplasma protein of unknown function, DUF285 [Seminavis robusta]|eukprot:Sro585_g171080.1 Mycoplasma protein of unknown function, DUF285 (406) ;mRNA; r:51480-52788
MTRAFLSFISILLLWNCLAIVAATQNRQYTDAVAHTITLTNENLQSALRLWMDTTENDRTLVEQLYGGPIEEWDITGITALDEVFADTHNFHPDLSQWDVSRVTSLRAAFYNTTRFAANIASWDVSRVVDMRVMLAYSSDFISDISSWNTASLQNLRAAFTEYKTTATIQLVNRDSPDTLPISNWQTPELTDMEGLFAGTHNFHIDLGKTWSTSKVTSMAFMMEDTVNFYGGDLSLLDTSRVESMERMFAGAVNVRAARDISKWDTSNVYNMDRIFFNTTVTLDNEETAPADVDLFYLCWDLTGLEVDTLEEAACNSNAGGFNCDCVPENLVDTINSNCSMTTKTCFHSLAAAGSGTDEAQQDEEAASLVVKNDDVESSSRKNWDSIGWRWWLLASSASFLLWVG